MLATTYLFLAFAAVSQQSTTLPSDPSPSSDAISQAHLASLEAENYHPPVLVYSVDPEITEAARQKHISGDVRVTVLVDQNGRPQRIRVVKGIGFGLDEKAVEAVRQYRYKPATAEGKPVTAPLTIDVNFQIF